jgi:hypothetical protein
MMSEGVGGRMDRQMREFVVLRRRWGRGLKSVLEGFLEAPMARFFFILFSLFIGGAVGGTGALLVRDSAAEEDVSGWNELSCVWLLLLALDANAGCHSQSRGHNGYLLIRGLGQRGEDRGERGGSGSGGGRSSGCLLLDDMVVPSILACTLPALSTEEYGQFRVQLEKVQQPILHTFFCEKL